MLFDLVRVLDAAQAKGAHADARVRVGRLARAAEQQRFTVSFYLTAMLFIVFDIEIVFLYPLAVVLDPLGSFGLVEFCFFIGDPRHRLRLRLGKGALEWR